MTSRLRWKFSRYALLAALGAVWLGCATSSGEPANGDPLRVPVGATTTLRHFDMCGALLGKTIVTDAVYDEAFKEAIAEGKAVQDSIKHAAVTMGTAARVAAPANVSAKKRLNPPLALLGTVQGNRVIQREPAYRTDSLVNIDHRFAHFLGNVDGKFYATNNQMSCGGIAMPEVQEVQRLINEDHSFGPQVQLTALPGGAALNEYTQFDTGYVLVAVANVRPDVDPQRQWYPMKTGYSRLNLVTGANCIFLRHSTAAPSSRTASGGDSLHVVTRAPQAPVGRVHAAVSDSYLISNFVPGSWSAVVVPQIRDNCDASGVGRAPQLDVVAFGDGPVDSIPPAARFIEGKHEMSLIGVKCARAWCVLGPDPRGDLQAAVHDTAYGKPGSPQRGRRTSNPLWFDEQHLAIPDPGNPKKLIPGFRASIIPDTGLQNPARNYKDKWYPMAYVFVPENPPEKYAKGYGLRPGWNQFRLRQVEGIWFAMIVSADGSVHVREVAPMEHTFGEVPGTVRWDWVDTDDLVWVPCSDGCCLIQDGRDYE